MPALEPAGELRDYGCVELMADECLRRFPSTAKHDRSAGTRPERVVRQDNYRVFIMDNSKFFGSNLLDRLAEHVGVLEPDVGEKNDARVDHVGPS